RNDRVTVDEIAALHPDGLIISPGPGTPDDGGVSLECIARFQNEFPILGVCLGHQCIGQHYGGVVRRADRMMHGKTSMIHHNGKALFSGIQNPFTATRYHSLIVDRASLPDCLEITAQTDEEEIMGLQHKDYPVYGVQFHPESILTLEGQRLLGNFLKLLK
ncbi:MAG: anthranilate synthase component II, partial [Candidatus Hinthialibacter sp.]